MNESTTTPDIRDIVVPAEVPSYVPLLIALGLALLLAAVLAVLILVWIRATKKDARRPPHPGRIAMEALDHIAAASSSLPPNAFALQISEVLKNYIHQRYHDSLRYETSQEFLARVSAAEVTHVPMSKRQMLTTFLLLCDEVKFSRPPDAESKRQPLLDHARMIVREQRPEHVAAG